MQNTLPTYGPPSLNEAELKNRLLKWYPSHTGSKNLLDDLVEEYERFWRLVLSYPHRRVVAPGPIMAVQRAHFSNRQSYFQDCMDYFNKFMPPKVLAWGGTADYSGIHDTVTVYRDLYNTNPPDAWADMTNIYGIRRNGLTVVSRTPPQLTVGQLNPSDNEFQAGIRCLTVSYIY